MDACAEQLLVALDFNEATKADFYSCKLLFQSTVRKVESSLTQSMATASAEFTAVLESMKSKVSQIEATIAQKGF